MSMTEPVPYTLEISCWPLMEKWWRGELWRRPPRCYRTQRISSRSRLLDPSKPTVRLYKVITQYCLSSCEFALIYSELTCRMKHFRLINCINFSILNVCEVVMHQEKLLSQRNVLVLFQHLCWLDKVICVVKRYRYLI